MRPYLAVVKDSFREALASRTLWILLILITVTLAALAPFSFREVLTTALRHRDLSDPADFIGRLRGAADDRAPSPARHIWSLLDPGLQDRLRAVREPDGDAPPREHMRYEQTVAEFRDALNALLQEERFYNAEAWRGVDLRAEARRLAVADPAELTPEEIGRRNRLALEAAFPEFVRISPPLSTQFTYLGMTVFRPVPFPPDELQESLVPGIVMVLDWVVGPVGVFVAVLVTASIIPQMFDAGSLNLLLSKPISRSLLYLFKFLGGCAFTLIAAMLLFIGLWLILGLRMGIWSHKLLLYIPIYLFLFAIYYSVSAFAGLVWRSTIVAIAVSVAFWAACYGVGTAEWSLRLFAIEPPRITYLVQTKDTILTVDEMSVPRVWDEKAGGWRDVFLTERQQRIRNEFPVPIPLGEMAGRVYDPARDLFLAVQRDVTGPRKVWAGRGADDWRRLGGAPAPSDVMGLFLEPQGTIVIVTENGVQRIVGDPTASSEAPKLFGLERFLPVRELLEDASRDLPRFPEPHAAALDPVTGKIAVFSRGLVYRLGRHADGRYAVEKEVRLEGDEDDPAAIAFGGPTILVAQKNGEIVELDAPSLAVRAIHRPQTATPPRFAYAAPGGRYLAVLFHEGTLWLFDLQDRSLTSPRFTGQGDISAIAFPTPDEILVADRATRVSRYALNSRRLVERLSPEMELLEIIYHYAVVPIYTVFPKPSELYTTSQYLVTGKTTQPLDDDEDDLSERQIVLQPWRPVWSSLAFMLFMLAAACVYFERQEF